MTWYVEGYSRDSLNMLLFIFLCSFSGAEASVEAETADQSCALNVCYIRTHSVKQFPSALTLFRKAKNTHRVFLVIGNMADVLVAACCDEPTENYHLNLQLLLYGDLQWVISLTLSSSLIKKALKTHCPLLAQSPNGSQSQLMTSCWT